MDLGVVLARLNHVDFHQFGHEFQECEFSAVLYDLPRLHVKVVNRILPTNQRLHKYAAFHTDECPLCPEIETHEHLFRCRRPKRKQWRSQFLKKLTSPLEKLHTAPMLEDGIRDGFQRWFQRLELDYQQRHPQVHAALRAQTRIGWFHLWTGHLASDLISAQDTYLASISSSAGTQTLQTPSKQWAVVKLYCLFGNNGGFSGTLEPTSLMAGMSNNKNGASANGSSQSLLQADQGLHYSYVEVHIQKSSTNQIQNWINIWQPVIEHSAAQAKVVASLQTHQITRFFPPPED